MLSQSKVLPADFDFQGQLPGWRLGPEAKSLEREFVFTDFNTAFEFMTSVARYAEEINHHPDWSNSWNKVSVSLSTHSAQALTELDLALALAMDRFAQQVKS